MKKNLVILTISLFFIPLTCISAEEFRELPVSTYINKMKAGWLGQMAGVGWGAPTEFLWKGEIIPACKMPQWQPEMVNQFEQDDIYVEMTFLRTLELHGLDVGIRQAGIDFANSQYRLAHANLAGRCNLRNGIAPPDSGHPKFNRHADDIDYQIEADFSGLICPGLGNEVIGLGEKFGRLMNYGDGLYGGQFVGGMYAEAFFEKDVHKIIQAGLACVPKGSQFHECISDTIEWHRQNPDNWQKTWELIDEKYHDNPDYRKGSCNCHRKPFGKGDFNIDAKINAAYIVMGLLYGEGDIDKTIIISTRCGQDSDCNPSNAAGVLCTTIGYSNIPERFKSALDPKGKFSHTPYNFDSLVAVCEKLTRQAVVRSGGRIERGDCGKELFVIPNIKTKPSKLEQCWEPGPIASSRFTPEERAKMRLKVTLSESKMGLADVTYDDLKLGEFMRKWLILGPMLYPGHDDFYGNENDEGIEISNEEQKIVFDIDSIDVVNFEPKKTISNTDYQWAVLETEDNTIDLAELVKEDRDFKVAYLWAQIEMPEDKTYLLGIGYDNGVKVWLNGELVHENWLIRGVTEDDDHVRVSFKKGKNQLVLKIQNGEGPWGFCCRLIACTESPPAASETLITNGLILDLDADKDVTLEDGNMVTNWKNQVAGFAAQDFTQRDLGREIPGSGRPTLKEDIAELGGHNSLVFREDELVNMHEDAFDHLITGGGYTWFTVMNAYAQTGKLEDVSVFFGNLNCDRECEGFWAGFEDDSDLWTGPRNGITFGRYNADNPKLMGPRFEENKYYVVAGRLAAGTGTVITDVFVNSSVPYASVEFPVNPDADASVMAIGTERDAWQHPGAESFDGELARVLFYERPLSDDEMAQTIDFLKIFYFDCGDQKSEKFDSDGPTELRVEQDEAAGTISVFRADGKEAIVTQNAKPDFRPFLHPIVAPDGKGLLTEYSPGHHKHQTGLYWGFTRVNGQAVSEDTLKEWFYRQDKPEEIAKAIGRDYFHHPDGDYWQRVSASVLQGTGEEVMWQTVYNMLDERGNTILTETQRWSMREQGGKYLLNLEWNGNAKTDVTIGEFDYGGMFLRMPWREGIKGQVVNSARQVNEQAEGQRAAWVDVGMQVEGREDLAHIAIFDHHSNGGYPQTWRVDGQLGVGPVRARLGDWKIEKGKTETIRHQIVAYAGDQNEIELTKLWQEYSR